MVIFSFILMLTILYGQLHIVRGKDYYCTQADIWKKAMEICLGAGGEPVSLTQLEKTPELNLLSNSTVWTGDYIEHERVTSIPNEAAAIKYDCGFMTLNRNQDYDNVYSPSKLQYTSCSEIKNYFCKSESSGNLKKGRSTWFGAYESCDYPYKLWEGFSVRSYNDYDGVDTWVLAAKTYTSKIAKAVFALNDKTIVACGTNTNNVSRVDPNNCEDKLQAICRFDNRSVVSANFTKSCLKESKQGETTVQTRHFTEAGLPVTEDNNNTVTIHTNQDSLLQSRTIVIIVIALSVVIFCVLTGIVIFVLGRKSRKGQFEKQKIIERSEQTVSTTDINGEDRNAYSNEVTTSINVDSEYYNVCQNKNAETIEVSHYNTYTVPETEYGDVYSLPTQEKQTNTLTTNETIVEAEYSTTNAIKAFNDSTNIYNKLGFYDVEPVYDNNEDSVGKTPPEFIDDTYSTTHARETYSTLNTSWNQGKPNSSLSQGKHVIDNVTSCLTNKDNVYYNGNISRDGNEYL